MGATTVHAATLYDVEQAGAAQATDVINRLGLAARYSYALAPSGGLREYQRSDRLKTVTVEPIAGVEGLKSGRKWLRGYGMRSATHPLDKRVLDGLMAFIGEVDETVSEAVVAWRRASMERDASQVVVALNESLEFYAANVKVPKMFGKHELARCARPSRVSYRRRRSRA